MIRKKITYIEPIRSYLSFFILAFMLSVIVLKPAHLAWNDAWLMASNASFSENDYMLAALREADSTIPTINNKQLQNRTEDKNFSSKNELSSDKSISQSRNNIEVVEARYTNGQTGNSKLKDFETNISEFNNPGRPQNSANTQIIPFRFTQSTSSNPSATSNSNVGGDSQSNTNLANETNLFVGNDTGSQNNATEGRDVIVEITELGESATGPDYASLFYKTEPTSVPAGLDPSVLITEVEIAEMTQVICSSVPQRSLNFQEEVYIRQLGC